jgi:hypothetical protein
MKSKSILIAGLFAMLLVMATAAVAQSKVDGNWEMSMQGRQGNTMTQTLTLKTDGNKLSGSIKGQRGETPISDGTVDGDKISFTVTRQTPNGEFKQTFNGTVDGDNIKGTVQMGENSRDWTAKRAAQ